MNDTSSINPGLEMSEAPVIKPWLSGGLIAALVSMAILSGILILGLRDFENTKRYALEAAAALQKAHTEMSTLQAEIDSLKTQKETLASIVVTGFVAEIVTETNCRYS